VTTYAESTSDTSSADDELVFGRALKRTGKTEQWLEAVADEVDLDYAAMRADLIAEQRAFEREAREREREREPETRKRNREPETRKRNREPETRERKPEAPASESTASPASKPSAAPKPKPEPESETVQTRFVKCYWSDWAQLGLKWGTLLSMITGHREMLDTVKGADDRDDWDDPDDGWFSLSGPERKQLGWSPYVLRHGLRVIKRLGLIELALGLTWPYRIEIRVDKERVRAWRRQYEPKVRSKSGEGGALQHTQVPRHWMVEVGPELAGMLAWLDDRRYWLGQKGGLAPAGSFRIRSSELALKWRMSRWTILQCRSRLRQLGIRTQPIGKTGKLRIRLDKKWHKERKRRV
jgi:hypothetical protein